MRRELPVSYRVRCTLQLKNCASALRAAQKSGVVVEWNCSSFRCRWRFFLSDSRENSDETHMSFVQYASPCKGTGIIEPPFSFRLAEKKTAVHGQKKRALRPSRGSAVAPCGKCGDGAKRCGEELPVSYRVRCGCSLGKLRTRKTNWAGEKGCLSDLTCVSFRAPRLPARGTPYP